MEDQRRAGAWDVLKWAEHHRPSFVVVENVREFREWGPLDAAGRPLQSLKGKYFDAWLMAMRAGGYRVEHAILNAADFGAATSRQRLFVIARKGNRSPVFPEPTHSRDGLETLFGKLPRWRPMAEEIDWSLPCPSIFGRKRPLADKTLSRIEIGLRKFVGAYLVKLRGTSTVASTDEPCGTITAGGGHHALAVPFQFQLIGRGAGRSRGIDSPISTIVAARENHGLVVPYVVQWDQQSGGSGVSPVSAPLGTIVTKANRGLCLPYMVEVNHGDKVPSDSDRRVKGIDAPLGTITTSRGAGLALPFLSSYYGTGDAQSIDDPLDTITTKDRHSLLMAHLGRLEVSFAGQSPAMVSLLATMRELGVADIGFRMLSNPELSKAQGFDPGYLFTGSKTEVTCQIGNSVSPNVAERITLALAGV